MRIVFVHFGRKAPKHLVLNLKRCASLFPNTPIVLITNKNCKMNSLEGVQRLNYTPDSNWHEVDNKLSHPREFRENFWLTSLTRFIAIENYQKTNDVEILHVESDVILAPDFPLKTFSVLKKPSAFSIISPTLGIASITYLRNHKTSNELLKVLLSEVNKDSSTTDMLVLKKFHDLFPNLVQILPIGPDNPSIYKKELKKEMLDESTNELQNFGGIFDGADLGYYMFGEDPRNNRGRLYLRKTFDDHFLDLKKVSVEYSNSRNFVDLIFESKRIPIFCLHIHSKNKKIFANQTSQGMIINAVNSFYKPPQIKFIYSIFIKAVFISIIRRLNLLLFATNIKGKREFNR